MIIGAALRPNCLRRCSRWRGGVRAPSSTSGPSITAELSSRLIARRPARGCMHTGSNVLNFQLDSREDCPDVACIFGHKFRWSMHPSADEAVYCIDPIPGGTGG
eukprot:GHVT01066217.1.p1 GENE.GHVT01066217.1~~GHVT01066217.1.p1  ORF type:complete len:104 (-),score=6.78 GHVT01066217.1:5-316(-)